MADVTDQVADALQYAHEHGVIHATSSPRTSSCTTAASQRPGEQVEGQCQRQATPEKLLRSNAKAHLRENQIGSSAAFAAIPAVARQVERFARLPARRRPPQLHTRRPAEGLARQVCVTSPPRAEWPAASTGG